MCCQVVCCKFCLGTWLQNKDTCPACKRINPIQIPLQLNGIKELMVLIKDIPYLFYRPPERRPGEAPASPLFLDMEN